MISSAVSAFACTGFYVGKGVSSDGSTLIARTVDLAALGIGHRVAVHPRVENAPGRVYRGIRGFEWPLPATTWKYVATPRLTWEGAGDFSSVAANEKGFVVSATVTGYVREEISAAFPATKDGCAEANLTDVLAASCANVQEALDLIARLMKEKGTHERNIVMIADPKEAWLVEFYTGHLWAAMRLPEDKVAAFGNNFLLGAYDPASPDWRAASDIETAPAAKGLAVKTADGKLDLFHTYSGRRYQYANIRSWFGKRFFAPGTEGTFSDGAEFPLVYAPSRKIGAGDLMAAMRLRYEGTAWCPDETGREDVRVIGTSSQCSSHVISLRDDLPAERAATVWLCLGPAEHGVYLPMANNIDAVDPEFARDWTEDRHAFRNDLACDAFRRLAALCQVDRVAYGRGVRDFWALREQDLLARWPSVFARGDAKEMSEFTRTAERQALADARRLHDEVEWHVAANGRTLHYKQDQTTYHRVKKPAPYAPAEVKAVREQKEAAEIAACRAAIERARTAIPPPEVTLRPLGVMATKDVCATSGTNWILGCETLDRDFADFEKYKHYLKPLGIRRMRLQAGWAKCEPVVADPKHYDFRWLDRQVDFAASVGIRAILETGYGNPQYKGGGSFDLAGGLPSSPEALAAWDTWVRALVRHFRGRVDEWYTWNEPDGEDRNPEKAIFDFTFRTARTIKAADPKVRIGALSLAELRAGMIDRFLAAGGAEPGLFETVVYHSYRWAPEEMDGTVRGVKEIVAKHSPTLRLRQGENGCPSEETHRFALDGVPWTETSQAKWNLRRMLSDLGNDVESGVFTICDFNHKGREINRKGLLRADADHNVIAVKPAYCAVQHVATLFDGTVRRVVASSFASSDARLRAFEYAATNGTPVYVFWACADEVRENGRPKFVRPGDGFATHPAMFTAKAPALKDPVWVDLRSGRIYELLRQKVSEKDGVTTYADVPVYDSPCVLTERSLFVPLRGLAEGVLTRITDLPKVCHEVVSVKDRAPSLLPDGRKFALVWHDEFDGTTLDATKWMYRTNFWGRSAHWFATPEDGCVEVTNGLLRLTAKQRADGQYVSPQLQTGELMWDVPELKGNTGFWYLDKRAKTLFEHRYGYYECRCRLQRTSGWWTAFWMQTEMQGASLDPARSGIEHDIMESFDPGRVIPAAFHMCGYGPDYRGFTIPEKKEDQSGELAVDTEHFHTFGLLWEPTGYSVYVDGRLRGRSSQAVSLIPEFLLLTTECKWYRNNRMTGKPVGALKRTVETKDDFVVDYVRVYDVRD